MRTLRPDDADRSAAADVELQTRPRVDGPTERAARAALARGDIVQRRVPHLLRVDGRAFDLGVYVLLRGRDTRRRATDSPASPGSWSASAFDETLLRFVSDEAEHDAVGAVYPAAWDLPSLASRGAGNADARFAPTAWRALARFLVDEGYGNDAAAALRRDALDVIAASLDAAAPIVASAVVDAGRDAYPDGAGHFFRCSPLSFAPTWKRTRPDLAEVNASPNVKSRRAAGRRLDRLRVCGGDRERRRSGRIRTRRARTRRCATTPAAVRGRALLHHGAEGEDCVWSDWGQWSACPAWCERSRTRTATYPETYHGAHCDGAGRETEPCVDGDCVVASPPPPPTPPSPPEPPPPSTSSTFERILELPALDGEFGVAAQDALIAVVAVRTGAAISTVTMVSYEAHATATARVGSRGVRRR